MSIRRDPETGRFVAVDDEGGARVIDADLEDLTHQHVSTNLKWNASAIGQTETFTDGAVEPLDGDLKAGDLALLVGLTMWDTGVKVANEASQQTHGQVNINWELTRDEENHFSDNDQFVDQLPETAVETGSLDVFNTRSELGDLVLYSVRYSLSMGFNDSTNGAAAGSTYALAADHHDWISYQSRFGSPPMFDSDDELNVGTLFQPDNIGGSINISIRPQFTLHWLPIQGDRPEVPELEFGPVG